MIEVFSRFVVVLLLICFVFVFAFLRCVLSYACASNVVFNELFAYTYLFFICFTYLLAIQQTQHSITDSIVKHHQTTVNKHKPCKHSARILWTQKFRHTIS